MTVLSQDDGGTDGALRQVVVEGHLGLVRKSEQPITVFAEALGQAQRVGIAIDQRVIFAFPCGQPVKPPVEKQDAARVAMGA